MSNSPSSPRVVFSKKYGHFNVLWSLVKWPVLNILLMKSRQYIASKKQLVVFSFDYIGHCINLEGVFEHRDLETFFEWIGQYKGVFDGIAIDIGANIGNHSLFFSDFFRKVLSFEPNPRTFKVLSINSELASNITCFNLGISSSTREGNLNVSRTNMGGSFVSSSPTSNSLIINLQTLDSIVDDSEKIKLIKIDVEGHEYDALLGSEATIRKHNPMILFEQRENDFSDGRSKVVDLLKSYGYQRFAFIRTHPRAPQNIGFFFQGIYGVLGKLIFGESMRVVCENDIGPGFYPFIIAIPRDMNV